MLNIDLFDNNSFRRKELAKFLIQENYIVKSHDNIKKLNLDPEFYKIIVLSDAKTYSNYKEDILRFNKKEQLIILIDKKLKNVLEELSKNNIKNFIYLPITSIKELIVFISELLEKNGLTTDKKNLLNTLLDEMNIFIEKCKCDDVHNIDKLKNKIHLLNKLIKQYSKSRQSFSGTLYETPIFELLKFIQVFFSNGVLKIQANQIEGTISIQHNCIINASSNVFSNSLKSFDILSSLNTGTFTFSDHTIDITNKELASLDFNSLVQRAYNNYKWFKINKEILPKENINLKINQKILFSNKINKFEFEVLSDIVKNSLIKNLLALNSLNLIDTYETLINLRRKGILEVIKR